MTTYKIIRGLVTSQGPKQTGDLVTDLPDREAEIFMAQGRIVPHNETVIKAASVDVTHRDPQPAKKRGRATKIF